MSVQNLIQPINRSRCTAGYKNQKYNNRFNMVHYGCDYTNENRNNNNPLYSLGSGIVLDAGNDRITGNTVIIRYDNVKVQKTTSRFPAGQIINVVCRMWHLESISVTKSNNVNKDTTIGYYGQTGQAVYGAHLHIEFDTDLVYYQYTPSLRSGSNGGVVRGGTDSTVSPGSLICTKLSSPDNQSSIDDSEGYASGIDWNFVKIT